MKTKIIATATFSIFMMLGVSGCGGSSSTKDISGETLTSDGTQVCSSEDISGKALQISSQTNYTITHNQDGTKTICITSGQVIIN